MSVPAIPCPLGFPFTDRKARPMLIHVATLGARQHYAKAKILESSGMLWRLHTDVYAGHWPILSGLLRRIPRQWRPPWVARFLGRCDGQIPFSKVRSYNAFGLWYQWKARLAGDSQAVERIYIQAAQRFNAHIIRDGEIRHADAVIGFDGAVMELFEYAKPCGIGCILEQTIVPQATVRALLKEEQERWPEWEPWLGSCPNDNTVMQRQMVEWRLANLIIGGSAFVLESLRPYHVPQDKCRLIPYGIPLARFSPKERGKNRGPRPLHVLFVGEIELRKGVPYLLEALRILKTPQIAVKLAGTIRLDRDKLKPYRQFATFLGQVPRARIMELYDWADVFVLPSICEGSALVTYEALACGLPVIATPNTGAPLSDGTEGILISVRDSEALARTLEMFVRDQAFL